MCVPLADLALADVPHVCVVPQKWPIKRMIWYGILRKCQHRFVYASPGTLKCSMLFVCVRVFHATHIASFSVSFALHTQNISSGTLFQIDV